MIIEILTKNHIQYFREVSFHKCKNPDTGGLFRFDFYIPKHNLIIEYDGQHHKEEYFIKADTLKNRFCKKEHIGLLRLDKKDFYNLETPILNKLKSP